MVRCRKSVKVVIVIHEVRHPTLELDWLPQSMRKSLDRVRVVFTDTIHGGRYWSRIVADKPELTSFDFDRREAAVIEIGANKCAGTLAHEYRHHWQRQHGLFQPFTSVWSPSDDSEENYWKEILRYFTTYAEERDALLFESRYAPNDVTREWIDRLQWVI